MTPTGTIATAVYQAKLIHHIQACMYFFQSDHTFLVTTFALTAAPSLRAGNPGPRAAADPGKAAAGSGTFRPWDPRAAAEGRCCRGGWLTGWMGTLGVLPLGADPWDRVQLWFGLAWGGKGKGFVMETAAAEAWKNLHIQRKKKTL